MSRTKHPLNPTEPSQRIVKAGRSSLSDHLFETASLYPRDTGLLMTVWVSPRGRARRDARVKVCRTPGDRMDATNTAVVVAVRPEPRVIAGTLPVRDLEQVGRWIKVNEAALIEYWNGALSTVEFAMRLQRVDARRGPAMTGGSLRRSQ